jgi:hypothetical protein
VFRKSLSGRRRASLFVAAAVLFGGIAAGSVVSPAQADEGWRRGREYHRDGDRREWRGHEWREHARREHEWRERERWRREAYRPRYFGPPVIYGPRPPVIYRPPVVVVPY